MLLFWLRSIYRQGCPYVKKRGEGLSDKAPTPMSSGYCLEIDITPELGEEDAAYYHSLIGVLR